MVSKLRFYWLFLFLSLGNLAHAGLFSFSYTFGDGAIVTGNFSGEANGNLVSEITDVSVFYNGAPFAGNGKLFGAHQKISSVWTLGGATASFDGLENNFYFGEKENPNSQDHINFFFILPNSDRFVTEAFVFFKPDFSTDWGSQNTGNYPYPYGNARWTLTATVPEPGTLALVLLSFGLLVGVKARRKLH